MEETGFKEGLGVNIQEFLLKNKFPVTILLVGCLALLVGIFLLKGNFLSQDKIEVLEGTTEAQKDSFIVVEISGEVSNAGVYKLPINSRIEDILVSAGGLSLGADRSWVEKNLNRAAKLSDGQKIYIPSQNQQIEGASANNFGLYQSDTGVRGSGQVNINTSSRSELESLNGIGPVYAQKIIEQRPYSNIEELLSKKVIPKSTYEKIQNEISVY